MKMIKFIKRLFQRNQNIKPTLSRKNSITIGINAIQCNECEKWNKGVELYNMFTQGPARSLMLRYDKECETFLINEDMLMRAIQLVSPMQKPRKLKLISMEEWFNFKR